MHECADCGQACGCDGDDLWRSAPIRCTCMCEDIGEAEDDDPDDDDGPEARCVCGAYQWNQKLGHWYQVADCCCPPVF